MNFTNYRTIQIIPATGWWAVYAQEDGTTIRRRVVAFAVQDEWFADDPDYEWETKPPKDADVTRVTRPLVYETTAHLLEPVNEYHNFLGMYHDDEWADVHARFEEDARRWAAKEAETGPIEDGTTAH